MRRGAWNVRRGDKAVREAGVSSGNPRKIGKVMSKSTVTTVSIDMVYDRMEREYEKRQEEK